MGGEVANGRESFEEGDSKGGIGEVLKKIPNMIIPYYNVKPCIGWSYS